MMKPWIAPLALAAAFALAGCDDNPRKEVSTEDVCAAYKVALDKMLKDPSMTDQDRRAMLPRLAGYSMCKDTVGTGGISLDAAGGAPAGPPNEAALRNQRSSGQ